MTKINKWRVWSLIKFTSKRVHKRRRSGPYLTLVILARIVGLHSLKVAQVMRLKGKECILENQTDSVKAEGEILYI